MNDYLDEKTNLKALYNRFPKLENFSEQIHEKQNNFTFENRKILVDSLNNQYQKLETSERTSNNIKLLNE